MKVLMYSIHGFEEEVLSRLTQSQEQSHDLTLEYRSLDHHTVALSEGYEAIAIFTCDLVDADILKVLSSYGVKYISTRSVGFDHIDLIAAKKNSISIANVPAYSPYAVSELGVALLLSIIRKLPLAEQLFNSQDFRLDQLVGFDLHGKTIGIIGLGNIGKNYARIMQGFGCNVIAYDIKSSSELSFVMFVNLDELLRRSDVVFLSCPLNVHTFHLIGAQELAKMKKNAILINTARGGVIDTLALVVIMEEGHLAGAGLDVYENEQGLYFYDHSSREVADPILYRLMRLPQVHMTAHQGFLTNEALEAIVTVTCQNLSEWERTGQCTNSLT